MSRPPADDDASRLGGAASRTDDDAERTAYVAPLFADDDASRVAGVPPAERRRGPPRLTRYRLERVLGEGAMGQVWLAHDPALSRPVAIKLVHGDGASGRAHLERLAREARSLARLSHPNVVAVFDVGTYALADEIEHEGLYIVMELVVGPTLAQWLATSRRTDAILAVFVQAAHGLAAAHDAGLVHRDFKPANVLVGDDGRVRVGDFGLARRGPEDVADARAIVEELDAHEMVETLAGSLTDVGAVVGTPLYMAPEQHRGEAADASSDQYAFCVALYEALAGRRPFVGEMERTYAAKVARQLEPPLAGHEIPRRLLDVVLRGLAPSREERWPSMRALIAELRPPRSMRVPAMIAAAVVAGVLGIAAASTSEPSVASCMDRRRIDDAWDVEKRNAVTATVTTASSEEHATRAVAQLEGRVEALRQALARDCGVASTAVGACLRDATTQLVTTIDVLAVDERAAAEATAVLSGLEDPTKCASTTATDVPLDANLLAIRDRETTANALWNANQPDVGLAEAIGALEQARLLGETARATTLRLTQRVASMYEILGEIELARAGFHDAYYAATEMGEHGIAAMSAIHSAMIEAEAGRSEESERWTRHAEAALPRSGLDRCDVLQFDMYRAALFGLAGDFEAGADMLDRDVQECRELACGERCIVATANLAQMLSQVVRDDEALERRREVVAQYLELRGPESLPTAEARINLAQSLLRRGDVDEALQELAVAMPLFEKRAGAGHPRLAAANMLKSQALRTAGDFAGAVDAAKRAVEIGALHSPPDHPQQIGRIVTLANALGDAGDNAAGLAIYDAALTDVAEPGFAHALVHIARGYTRMETGDLDGAIDDARQGRMILKRTNPRDVLNLTLSYQNEAEALVLAGRCADADRVFASGIEWAAAEAIDAAQIELTASRPQLAARCRPAP